MITDTGAADIKVVLPYIGEQTIHVSINSTVKYVDFVPQVTTNMGTFTHVLRVTVEITATGGGMSLDMADNTFFLKKAVGMIVQNQKPDPDDAEKQAIDSGEVGGVPIVPDIKP